MQPSRRYLTLLSSLVILAMIVPFLACSRAEEGRGAELNLNLGTEPPTLDPALATDVVSVDMARSLFVGLTDVDDKTSQIIPDLATKWDISPDGKVYTFHLRKDVRWSDGKPVTAGDVEYGIKRTLDPATASEYAHVLNIIKGAEDFNSGKVKDSATVGVKSKDDYTLEITLREAAVYFPMIASLWVTFPQPREAIEKHKEKWTEPANIVTNGPYLLSAWEHEKSVILKKNPNYYAAKDVGTETINFAMVREASTALTMYENGQLDSLYQTGVPLEDIDRVKKDPKLSKELLIAPQLSTYYYGFNNSKAPFDKPLVRKAFTAAIDRQTLIDTVLKGEQKPAQTFTAIGVFGHVDGVKEKIGVPFDPAAARKYLADAGYPDGKGLPEITLAYNTSEGHKKIAEAIQAMWKRHLGVDVKVANQEWKVFLKTLQTDPPQVFRMGWSADYPDANNWLNDVFHSKSGSNYARFKNPKFDELVEKAAVEPDSGKRLGLYKEAEKILVDSEAAIAPIYFYTQVQLTKPYLERTHPAFGGEHFKNWKIKK
ncbi:MAG: peptide ABC transporter substrate-binding protein [Chloroflexi bacterium]|nr:peptide ABC transporter substrate-binding protein [Chloroflexota bacterium]